LPSPIVAFWSTGLIAPLFAAVFLSTGAQAAESPWLNATDSKVRLISGTLSIKGEERVIAGVQIRMDSGWKTYWRNPGDSGVPPTFDWKGSTNLKTADVLYPAPRRFTDAGGAAIGYEDEVVFPVLVTPERPDEPVELMLHLSYGLCKDLCIPNEASLDLTLPPKGTAGEGDALLLARFLDLVPKPVEQGKLPALSGLEAKLDGPKPELQVDALFPADSAGGEVFLEAPDAYVPVPAPVGPPDNGKQRFLAIFGSATEAAKIKGKTLTVTLVDDRGARETTWTVE
jgi:DsbC/DsbD-like thiol-disulfide interchange protein